MVLSKMVPASAMNIPYHEVVLALLTSSVVIYNESFLLISKFRVESA